MKLNSKRVYFLIIGFISLMFIGLIGATYGIAQMLSTQSNQLLDQKAKAAALQQEQIGLVNAKKQVKTYADLDTIAKSVVPEDKDSVQTIREITNIAAANKITLSSIALPNSTLGSNVKTTLGSTSAVVHSSSPKDKYSQLTPVKNIPGVYVFEVTIASEPSKPVSYDRFISFLHDLEQNRRTALVSSINITPYASNHSLITFTLTLDEYIKP